MARFRWGIFGTGFVAKKFALGLRHLPDAEISAIGSRQVQSAQAFAHGLGSSAATGTYEEISQMSNVDAIYIATPPAVHLQQALMCIDAGKPVLVEKPFACNAEEARTIMGASQSKGVFCMEAMWTRFLPLPQQVKQMIDAGSLGEIRLMSGSFCMAEQPGEANNLFDPGLGGGALLDRAVYPISLALYLLGTPEKYSGQVLLGASGVDEQASISLQFGTACLAQFQVSLVADASNNILISGSRARLEIAAPLYRPFRLKQFPVNALLRTRAGPPGFKDALKENHWVHQLYQRLSPFMALMKGNRRSLRYAGNGYHYQAEEVMKRVGSGEISSEIMPLEQSVAVLEIIDGLRTSRR